MQLNNSVKTEFNPEYAIKFLDLEKYEPDPYSFNDMFRWSSTEEGTNYWSSLDREYCYKAKSDEEREFMRRDPEIRAKVIYYLNLAGIPWEDAPQEPPVKPGVGVWNKISNPLETSYIEKKKKKTLTWFYK